MEIAQYFIALLPVAILLVLVYKVDTVEKEPIKLIALCFVLGAVSTAVAIVVETVLDNLFCTIFDSDSLAYIVVEMVVGVALVEEGCKFAAGVIPSWKSKRFNYVFDGIVYCVAAALGFAALENILYVVGDPDWFEIGIMRSILSVPGHAMDGVFMGVFVGYAKYYKYQGNISRKRWCMVGAFAAPVLEHGIYDSICSLDFAGVEIALLTFVGVCYLIAIGVVILSRGKYDKAIALPADPNPIPQAMAFCGDCGTPVQLGAKFCTACGSAIKPAPVAQANFCGDCGQQLQPGTNFCPTCGKAVK